jgi:hypothetical protein
MSSHVRQFWFLAASPFLVICLLSSVVFAQEVCASNSSIDAVPFFIGQLYSDILNRVPDRGGQLFHIATLEGLNSTNCKSVNPSLSPGSCEWNNNAQTTIGFLSSPESIEKNGTLADNTAFVTALYQLLLRRSPDTGGLQWYVSLLDSGALRSSIVSSFLSSTEYRQRFTCTSYGTANPSCNGAESVDPVPGFVEQTYLDILNRPSDG